MAKAAFRQSGKRQAAARSVEVFRDAPAAAAAFKHDSASFVGGPVNGCDEGWLWVVPANAGLNCRVADVERSITAASPRTSPKVPWRRCSNAVAAAVQ